MSLNPGPQTRELDASIRRIEWSSPVVPLVGALAFVALGDSLSLVECLGFSAVCALYVALHALVRTKRVGGLATSILRQLDARETETNTEIQVGSTPAGSLSGQLFDLSLDMRRRRLQSMAALALAMPLTLTALGLGDWLRMERLVSVELALLIAAWLAATVQFYWARHVFRSIRAELDEGAADESGTPEAVNRISIVHELRTAIVGGAALCLILVLHLTSERDRSDVETMAHSWNEASLASLLDTDTEEPLETRLVRQQEAQQNWPLAIDLTIHHIDRVDSASRHSEVLMRALDVALAEGRTSGSLEGRGVAGVISFRQVGPSTVVFAAADLDPLRAVPLFGLDVGLGFVVVSLLGGLWTIAALMGRDLRGSVDSIRGAALELAAGRWGTAAFETGDDLGELGLAIQRTGASLRLTTDRVSSALDEVEETARASMTWASELVATNQEQSARLQQAMDLVVSIDARGCEVSQSAQTLNESVDDSSSSIAELGAAGTELNETASILSSQVDEISRSMEQMVRSVKQVSATTERLAGASEETSSSMEEMASAMRVVDTSAESVASLSLDVVAKAEIGQAKVCQTIEGMEAIREATDAAERVIRGLGSRTLEIGGILDVIEDVADETNLLALNAAIIAAQAGEHGKAFSVVADEIKELADRVLASTKEIGGLIRSVQEESENAIGAIEAGSQSVMSGVDLSAEAGRTLEEITEASRQNGVRIGEIVSSVREQTRAAGHVVELMEKVRDSADEISSASVEQDASNEVIYRSALTMREVAQQVRATTEEQSHGFGRIRESVEGVRSTVEHITGSLHEQAGACTEVSTFLQQVCEGTRANDEAFERLGGAMKELLVRAETLREDVERSQSS
jgi:methyl-accepting chemotaxis protein